MKNPVPETADVRRRKYLWKSEPRHLGGYDYGLENNSPWTAFVLSWVRNYFR